MKIFRFNPIFKAAGAMIALPLMVCMILFASCSSGNEADTLDILATVPSDAGMVAVANLNKVVTLTGGKVKDDKIVEADALKKFLADSDPQMAKNLEWLLTENSGVKCTSAVCFSWKGNLWLSALLSDAKVFKAGIDSSVKGDWAQSGKVSVKGNFAIAEDQVWISERVSNADIEEFLKFSDVESFKSNKYAETLSKADDAVSWWSSIDGLLGSTSLGLTQKTMVRMALGMFFKDPKYVVGSANLNKDVITTEASFLDSDLKLSKCELDLGKINTEQVASLGGNANVVMAVAVSQKMVKQFDEIASSIGGAMPAMYSNLLSPIDGTVAFASGEASTSGSNFKASIATNGRENAQLAQTLQAFGKVDIDGKLFTISNGSYGKGELVVADVAKSFRDAWLGIAVNTATLSGKDPKRVTILLIPADGSLKFKNEIQL